MQVGCSLIVLLGSVSTVVKMPVRRGVKRLLRGATKLAGLAARHITEGASYRRAESSSASAKIVTFNIVVSSYVA